MSDANGYSEPFRQLLEVSRQSAIQSTEQTILLRQVVEYLKDVESRHRESAVETREIVKLAAVEVERSVLAEMRSGEGWWRKAVVVIGIASALGGVASLARALQVIAGH